MKAAKLYGTLGCHLCDHAKEILWPAVSECGYRMVEIDIADSDELMAKFGVSIPVFENTEQHTLLYWPFSRDDVIAFLQK